MSSYIHVFARKNKTFVELLCSCRGSGLYQALQHYAPYEKIAPLSTAYIAEAKSELEDRLVTVREFNVADEQLVAQIGSWSNTVDEKLKAINEIQRSISELKEEMAELEAATHILEFLLNVEAELYVGEECGSDVTVYDIVESQ